MAIDVGPSAAVAAVEDAPGERGHAPGRRTRGRGASSGWRGTSSSIIDRARRPPAGFPEGGWSTRAGFEASRLGHREP